MSNGSTEWFQLKERGTASYQRPSSSFLNTVAFRREPHAKSSVCGFSVLVDVTLLRDGGFLAVRDGSMSFATSAFLRFLRLDTHSPYACLLVMRWCCPWGCLVTCATLCSTAYGNPLVAMAINFSLKKCQASKFAIPLQYRLYSDLHRSICRFLA